MTTDSTEKVLVIPTWRFRQYAWYKSRGIDFPFMRIMPSDIRFSLSVPVVYANNKKEPDNLLSSVCTASDVFKDLKLFKNQFYFRPRNEVETDETRIQLIPYFTINLTIPEQNSESLGNMEHFSYRPKTRKVLSYSRSNKSGESRLRDKRSIGFGGHINDLDYAYALKNSHSQEMIFYNTIRQGLNRELSEELSIDWNNCACHTMHYKGLIYDPTTDVGKVHLGIVFELSFSCNGSLGSSFDKYIKLNDDSNKDHLWIPYDEHLIRVTMEENNYEKWSILAVGLT